MNQKVTGYQVGEELYVRESWYCACDVEDNCVSCVCVYVSLHMLKSGVCVCVLHHCTHSLTMQYYYVTHTGVTYIPHTATLYTD